MYSYPGELVLDPFVGSGQTPKVAYWLKRQYVGYEIISKYVELAGHRITKPLSIRPKQLIAVFDKVGLDDKTNESSPQRGIKHKKAKGQTETAVQPRLLKEKVEHRSR